MTNEEFDLLEHLYFIISFEEINAELGWEENVLKSKLVELIQKDWVRCYKKGSEDIIEGIGEFESQYKNYHYLASKEGLLAHNSK